MQLFTNKAVCEFNESTS